MVAQDWAALARMDSSMEVRLESEFVGLVDLELEKKGGKQRRSGRFASAAKQMSIQ